MFLRIVYSFALYDKDDKGEEKDKVCNRIKRKMRVMSESKKI